MIGQIRRWPSLSSAEPVYTPCAAVSTPRSVSSFSTFPNSGFQVVAALISIPTARVPRVHTKSTSDPEGVRQYLQATPKVLGGDRRSQLVQDPSLEQKPALEPVQRLMQPPRECPCDARVEEVELRAGNLLDFGPPAPCGEPDSNQRVGQRREIPLNRWPGHGRVAGDPRDVNESCSSSRPTGQ